MNKNLKLSFLALLTTMCVSGCSGNKGNDEPKEDTSKYADVFVLAGQSNMEGNTFTSGLSRFCNDSEGEHSYDDFMAGYDNVPISFWNCYMTSSGMRNFSNPSDGIDIFDGLFVPTKLGFGVKRNSHFGPELGLAEKLNEVATDDRPIFLIKFTSGGTSITGEENRNGKQHWTWKSPNSPEGENRTGYLFNGMVEFVTNNLSNIEELGYVPKLKGLLWMQGESDDVRAGLYRRYMEPIVSDFREAFADYAVDKDGGNINFLDAAIYDGPNTAWGNHATINGAKAAIAESNPEHNFYVDTTCATGAGLQIASEEHGGGDGFHYTVDSMVKLGNLFAETIIENRLLGSYYAY